MKLLELCDPLFKYICLLNRSVKKQASIDAAQAESDIEAILSEIKSKARANSAAGLSDQYEKMEMPLIFFVDNVIANCPPPLSDNWQRLAYKRDRVTGDTDFCEELNRTLAEPDTPSSTDRLSIFYTCVGLGFTGDELQDPNVRRDRMAKLSRRIRSVLELEDRNRITPQAYGHTLVDDLVPPPVGPVWRIAVVLVGLIFVLIAVNAYLYRDRVANLDATLKKIDVKVNAK